MTNQNLNNSKRIFILGAGSSISHDDSFPSINVFFSKAKELGIDVKKEHPELHKYILKNFGIDTNSAKDKINIEIVFTSLEIDIERTQEASLQTIRLQILKLIQSVLIKLIEKIRDKESDLSQFAKRLDPKDTVITFNWDVLLDNILSREKFLRWAYNYKDEDISKDIPNIYHTFIARLSGFGRGLISEIALKPPYTAWDNKNGYFLKLHGSIDWVFCNNDLCRAFGEGLPVKEIGDEYYCASCHEMMHPLLIPPVLNKQYRKYHLIRRIWNTAFKEVETANEIIIWGYSLPETDFYSAWLLRNARQSIERLTLINPSVIKGEKEKKINKAFVNHFTNIFKGKLKKDSIILYENFKDYPGNLNAYEKYGIKF
ncbi:MAG: hypothetical protein ACOYU2_10795 [Nitrospirota bacterium]